MRWFPVILTMAIAAATFLGVGNPSRMFGLLPYFATAALIWIAIEGVKELRSSTGTQRTE